jgi:DNA-binding NtrC family response regulator
MANGNVFSVRILTLGLEESIGAELRQALTQNGHTVCSEPFLSAADSVKAIDRAGAGIVFCSAEPLHFEALLDRLRSQGRRVPVIVASRIAEVDLWLDAMDAGAHDYCAAPFEPRLLSQIVESAIENPRPFAVYAS